MGDLSSVVGQLDKDLRASVASLSIEEARYLVQTYYTMQSSRIRAAHQSGELTKVGKEHRAIEWLAEQHMALETRVKQLLERWTDGQPMGRWAKDITGVGPVIAAGLLAYIDIERAPTVGHIWRYAGLDPTAQRVRGEKLKYNPDLKVLCFKIGESFIKQQGREADIYGKLYLQRKGYEQMLNDAGAYAEQAAAALVKRNFRKDTVARPIYELGKLPPAHLHARARRWCVKLFLSHWHAEAYRQHYHKEPPLPYPLGIMGHAHVVDPLGVFHRGTTSAAPVPENTVPENKVEKRTEPEQKVRPQKGGPRRRKAK